MSSTLREPASVPAPLLFLCGGEGGEGVLILVALESGLDERGDGDTRDEMAAW